MDYRVAELPFPKGAIIVKDFNSPKIVYDITALALN